MVNLIATIIFLGSFLGIGVMLFRKISLVRELPLEIEKPQENLFSGLKNKIGTLTPVKSFSSETLLHKLLSKTRIFALKIENRIALWQERLREKSKKKKEVENDNYWEELRKSTKK